MNRRLEKTLSQILSVLVLIVFVTTLLTLNMNIWPVTYIWAISFLLAWVFMLIYSLHILFQKDSYGTSVFVALISAAAFMVLSVPAILVLARFLPNMPVGLSFGISILDQNSQLVIYTSLIVVYFAHLLNILNLRRKINQNEKFLDQEVVETKADIENHEQTFDEENIIDEDLSEKPVNTKEDSIDVAKNISEDKNNEVTVNNISSEDLKIGEKIVFKSNIDEKVEYNIDNIKIIEDLSDEDLQQMKGEDTNG